MELSKVRDWTDLVLKVLSSAAIVAAGAWALYQWRTTDSDADNIQVDVSIDVQPYTDALRLLVVHARAKNIGKVGVGLEGRGFVISVRALPGSLKVGAVDLEAVPALAETDIVKERYPDGYILEPGIQHDEVFAVVVGRGATYAAQAVIDLGDDTQEDGTAVVRVD